MLEKIYEIRYTKKKTIDIPVLELEWQKLYNLHYSSDGQYHCTTLLFYFPWAQIWIQNYTSPFLGSV